MELALSPEVALNYLMGFTVEMRPRKDRLVWTEWRDPEHPLYSTVRSAEQAWHAKHSPEEFDHQVIAVCGIPACLLGISEC